MTDPDVKNPNLKTFTYGPASGDDPESLVIFLHGWGANGQDLIGLAPLLGKNLEKTVFISPDAPQVCDMNPMGYQWFSLADAGPEARLKGTQNAAPQLRDYITSQREDYGVPASKTALVGFSQGTMMALYAGPRYPEKLAGILGYSGALIWEDDVDTDSLKKPPVRLIHGEDDNVVPVKAYRNARHTLEEAGFDVDGFTEEGLMHNISEKGIESGREFLEDILK